MPFESFSAAIAEAGLRAVAGALSVTGFLLVSPVSFALATFLVARAARVVTVARGRYDPSILAPRR